MKPVEVGLKVGDEGFHSHGAALGFVLSDFWRWSVSDLVSNATRGRLAEFIVAKALDISTEVVRDEWQAYDLKTRSGLKVEVKSAAYIQSWHQRAPSTIRFRIRRTVGWDRETGETSSEARHQADVYVFALLKHRDKLTVDPLNVEQWQFHVLPTRTLAGRGPAQGSIALSALEKLSPAVGYLGLSDAVNQAIAPESTGDAP